MSKYVIAAILIVFSFTVVQAEPVGKTYILTQKFPAGTYKITMTTQSKQNADRENNQKDGVKSTSLSIATVTFSQPDDSGTQTIRYRLTRYKSTTNDDAGRYSRVIDSDVDFQKKQTRLNNLVIFGLLFHSTTVFNYHPDGSVKYISGLDEEIEKNNAWNTTKQQIIYLVNSYVKANLANVRKSLPDKPVKIGDTWAVETSGKLPPNTKGTNTHTFRGTLKQVEKSSEGKIALINGTSKGRLDMTQDLADGGKGIRKDQNEFSEMIRIEFPSGLLREFVSTTTSEAFMKDFTSYACSGKTCSNPVFMKGTATFHSKVERKITVEKLPADKKKRR